MFYSTEYRTPVGAVTLVSDAERLVGLWNENHKYFAATVTGKPLDDSGQPVLVKACEWLDSYFAGERPPISDLALAPRGTSFRTTVWNLLCEIPYGEVVTYGDIARKVATRQNRSSMSSQAVGGAVGHNPLSIIIPCHRVVGANRSLVGYAAGVSTKLALLQHEGVDTTQFSVPAEGTAI